MKKNGVRIVLGLAIITAFSANASITGHVADTTGEPIIGAIAQWVGTNKACTTDNNGDFRLDYDKNASQLAISFVGYETDTIQVENGMHYNITLQPNTLGLDEVTVKGYRHGIIKSVGLTNQTTITGAELVKAACCNLGESFTTNPSVDVNYSDATTGAKQIKLLGLSGTYVQMLTENIPNFRGLAQPYALGYIPGPWMQSIQVSKGASSVKNGYESITGQINVEYLKPQSEENVNANIYTDSKSKIEVNADANYHLSSKLSGALLAHYEDNYGAHDGNNDGFLDSPKIRQVDIMNRWAWFGDNYIFQGGVKILNENRRSGQTTHTMSMNSHASTDRLFEIGIKTQRYEAFAKNAFFLNHDKNSNIALMVSGSYHSLDGTYGHKMYNADQQNFYASLMFESNFSKLHSISTGLSYNYDNLDETYRLTHNTALTPASQGSHESTPGAYAQYTFNFDDKLIAMAGVRYDYSSRYGSFITPRAHIKWTPIDLITLRSSIGKGYRTVHALAENNYLIASGRNLVVDNLNQEQAWNYGVSVDMNIPLFGKPLNLNMEYYYTNFKSQAIVDYDSNPTEIHITNLAGKSYSHTFQIDATYPVFAGFSFTAAYRLNDVKTTYGGVLMVKPLTNKSKTLFTATYKTPLELWQFDATLQLNGGGRLPLANTPRFQSFPQLNMQITRWFRHFSIYLGGENLTAFKQNNPIIGADTPWDSSFEPTLVWGPVHGAMFYVGMRYNLK
jgi:outer membrane receptor protein involved in Fe transport